MEYLPVLLGSAIGGFGFYVLGYRAGYNKGKLDSTISAIRGGFNMIEEYVRWR